MAIGTLGGIIPNPQKTLTINFSIERIKEALRLCHWYLEDIKNDKCKYDDILNIYTLSFSETLSLGSNMVISLNAVEPQKTIINIEMQRVCGSYNSSVEVDYANRQINLLCETISKILGMRTEDIDKLKSGNLHITPSEKKSSKMPIGCIIIITILLAIFCWALI